MGNSEVSENHEKTTTKDTKKQPEISELETTSIEEEDTRPRLQQLRESLHHLLTRQEPQPLWSVTTLRDQALREERSREEGKVPKEATYRGYKTIGRDKPINGRIYLTRWSHQPNERFRPRVSL